jgi:hypothetical protein
MIDLDHISDASFTDLTSLGKDDTTGTHAATNAAEAMVAAVPEYQEINEGINRPACAVGGELCRAQEVALPKDILCYSCEGRVHNECSIIIRELSENYLHHLQVNGKPFGTLDPATWMRQI